MYLDFSYRQIRHSIQILLSNLFNIWHPERLCRASGEAICICCIGGWVLTCQRLIYTGFLLFDIWSKYKNLLYFIPYVKFVSEFQMNMPHDYIGPCLLWSLLWWTMTTPPYPPWWVWHGVMDMVVQCLSALDTNALPLDLVAKKLDWLEAELEIPWWVQLLHSDTKHSKDWMTYLQPSLHRSALNTEGKTLTKAMCTKKWLQEGPWWGVTECSLGVDTVFWGSEYIWHFLGL